MTEKEFKNRVLPCKDNLIRLAVSMLGNRPAAEDAVQEVYLKLWNIRNKLPSYNDIELLALKVTKNLCIDRLRSYRRRKKNDDGLENMELMSCGTNPERLLELNDTLEHVYAIIRQLPQQQRLVIHLRDIEHYNYDEMETITGMSRNNLRVTLSRARHAVRDAYLKQKMI